MIIILISLSVFLISFLIINSLKFDKTFIIKEDKHFCSNFIFKFIILFKPKVFEYKINFISDFRYDIGQDQTDINKLIGLGFLPWHHIDSIRFGWRYNATKDRVEILAYSYVDKIRIVPLDSNGVEEVLANCLMNNNYFLNLEITETEYKLFVKDELNNIMGPTSVIKRTKNKKFSYLLKPYFGGNRTAPEEFKIKVSNKF